MGPERKRTDTVFFLWERIEVGPFVADPAWAHVHLHAVLRNWGPALNCTTLTEGCIATTIIWRTGERKRDGEAFAPHGTHRYPLWKGRDDRPGPEYALLPAFPNTEDPEVAPFFSLRGLINADGSSGDARIQNVAKVQRTKEGSHETQTRRPCSYRFIESARLGFSLPERERDTESRLCRE